MNHSFLLDLIISGNECNDDLANSIICKNISRSRINAGLYSLVTSNSSIDDEKYFNNNYLTDGSLSRSIFSYSCSKFKGLYFKINLKLEKQISVHSIHIINSKEIRNHTYRINLIDEENNSIICNQVDYNTKFLKNGVTEISCYQQFNRSAQYIEIINLHQSYPFTVLCEILVYSG